jgi:hypothetical protein
MQSGSQSNFIDESRVAAFSGIGIAPRSRRCVEFPTRLDRVLVKWLKAGTMDQELRQTLVDMETRINGRLDGSNERLDAVASTFNKRLDAVTSTFSERLEVTETKLLTAFHNWAQTYEVRARGTSAAVREFEERLGMVEERLAKLERGHNGQTNKP